MGKKSQKSEHIGNGFEALGSIKNELPEKHEPQPEPPADLPVAEAPEIQPEVLVPVNSRLYHELAPIYWANPGNIQKEGTLETFLNNWLIAYRAGSEKLPAGCVTYQDCLKPYWETMAIAGIPLGSSFALEHLVEFCQNDKLQQEYKNDSVSYLSKLMENSAPAADSLRPLNELEIKTWFRRLQRDLSDKYKSQGIRNFKKLAHEEYANLKNAILPDVPAHIEIAPAPLVIQPEREKPKSDEAGFLTAMETDSAGNVLDFVRSGKIFDLADKFNLVYADAYLAVAKKSLSPEQYQKFQSLQGLSREQIVKDFFGGQRFYADKPIGNLLYRALIWLLRENVPVAEPEKTIEPHKGDLPGLMSEIEDKWGGNYLHFLGSSDKFSIISDKYNLTPEEAFLDIARKALNAEQIKQFEHLASLPKKQISNEFFKGKLGSTAKKKLLSIALIRMLRANIPLPQPPEPEPEPAQAPDVVPQAIPNEPKTPSAERKYRTEPKTEGRVEDKQIWPEAEYYPSFQVVQKIMDKYGRLDVPTLEQQIVEFKNTEAGKQYLSRVTNHNETLSRQVLEQALRAMGFLKAYQAGLVDYQNSPDYQQKLVARARKEQDDWLRLGRTVDESTAFERVKRDMEFELLVKAVESFYHIRPETLKFEEEKLRVPESFEEVKYIKEPKCVIMRDKVAGFEYFGIPGPQGTWERVPLPDNINIDDPAQIQELYNIFSDMVRENKQPTIQLKNADGENFRDGVFEIYIDRTLVKSVPVRDFVNRELVRQDVRNLDRNNEIYKELLVKSFNKTQHNQSANFAQRDTRMQALEDLLLNTPLEDNVSFGDEAKFLALKRRIATARKQRVQGSVR